MLYYDVIYGIMTNNFNRWSLDWTVLQKFSFASFNCSFSLLLYKTKKYVKYISLPKQSTCQLWCISYCRVFDLLLVCSDTVCKICPRLSDAIFTAGRARWMTIFYVFFKGSVSMFKGWLRTILSHLFVRWLTLLTPKRQNCRYPS